MSFMSDCWVICLGYCHHGLVCSILSGVACAAAWHKSKALLQEDSKRYRYLYVSHTVSAQPDLLSAVI
jgi:hypothetical protein